MNSINNTTSSIQNDGTSSGSTLTTSSTVAKVNVAEQRAKVLATFTMLVNALGTDLPDVTTFLFRDQTITKADAITKLSARITAAENTKAARLALQAAVAAETQIAQEVAPIRSDIKGFLSNRFGKNSPKLQKFGFTPAKTPQKSVASKAQGVAKAKATREALGTKGKKQRKAAAAAIVAPAPVQAPPAPPVPAAPAAGSNGSSKS
jgi:hypothetical protein